LTGKKKQSNNEIKYDSTLQLDDIDNLRRELDKEKEKAKSYLANWQRSQADFANYKKRAAEEKEGIVDFANSVFIATLLPIVDDMEKALASLSPELENLNWVEGIKLIFTNFKDSLQKQGLSEINAVGTPFDPHFHNAVMRQNGQEGIVLKEIQKGYKFKNRVLRPSMVIVGEEKTKETGEETQKEE